MTYEEFNNLSPTDKDKTDIIQPIKFDINSIIEDNKNKRYVGQKFITNEGEHVTVIDYNGWDNISVIFNDNYSLIYKVNISNLNAGKISYPFHILSNGGYRGIGNYNPSKFKHIYGIWEGILTRVSSKNITRFKSYENVSVCLEWMSFQNFINWYLYNISNLNSKYTYNVDKDLLQIGKEYKLYSPYTCVIIPAELNQTLVSIENIFDKTTGFKYSEDCTNNPYNAQYSINNVTTHIGCYPTIDEAHSAYLLFRSNYIRNKVIFYYKEFAISEFTYNKFMELCDLMIELAK